MCGLGSYIGGDNTAQPGAGPAHVGSLVGGSHGLPAPTCVARRPQVGPPKKARYTARMITAPTADKPGILIRPLPADVLAEPTGHNRADDAQQSGHDESARAGHEPLGDRPGDKPDDDDPQPMLHDIPA